MRLVGMHRFLGQFQRAHAAMLAKPGLCHASAFHGFQRYRIQRGRGQDQGFAYLKRHDLAQRHGQPANDGVQTAIRLQHLRLQCGGELRGDGIGVIDRNGRTFAATFGS